MRSVGLLLVVAVVFLLQWSLATVPAPVEPGVNLSAKAALGRQLFFEARLSRPDGQSCASCHAPSAGFADPEKFQPTSNGIRPWVFGPRNAPTVTYSSFIPPLHWDPTRNSYIGGLFWDGRVDTLEQQAKLPFFNPLEMHNFSKWDVINGMLEAGLAGNFRKVYGRNSLTLRTEAQADVVFNQIADAIATWERSAEVNRFNSKFDRFLQKKAKLTALEKQGMDLFNGRAGCFGCHTSQVVGTQPGPLFTNFSYHNLGAPKNWMSPFLYLPADLNPAGPLFVDRGLGDTVNQFFPAGAIWEDGKFRTPTLRNVARTAPYGHNGVFATLKEIVHFYNTRDVPSAGWPRAEVFENMNVRIGNLGLTDQEEDAIVAFLMTLTDQ